MTGCCLDQYYKNPQQISLWSDIKVSNKKKIVFSACLPGIVLGKIIL